MPTIHDVAERAGVSIKTVSRVINQEPYVQERTRERVLLAMRELGYAANVSAQRLASGRANAIGFVFHNPSWQYLSTALQGVIEGACAAGYETLVQHCDVDIADVHGVRSITELVARRSVDGFIFTPPADVVVPVLAELQAAQIPFVRLTPRDRVSRQPYVTANDRQGACDMTRYLLALGHRRIGFVMGAPIQVASSERLEGYRAALAEAGIRFDPALVGHGDFSFESGARAARVLIQTQSPPTAIFASNDDMAAGVLALAHRLQVAVPADLSVAGFDNTPLSGQVWPALTTVNQPIHEIALLATRILLRMLHGEDVGIEHHHLATDLVIRASTGPAPR
jgi:LacI family transcriptional regulator